MSMPINKRSLYGGGKDLKSEANRAMAMENKSVEARLGSANINERNDAD